MLDKTRQTNPKLRIGIIGAGISGLVTAKVFLEQGFDVEVLEKSGDLGGVWEPARSYPGVKTQTPRDLYCFTDFPMPSDYPEWPSGPQVYAYLDAYATRFGLKPAIRFNTAVETVRPTAVPGKYEVVTTSADGELQTTIYDFVVVATGQFSRPNKLEITGEAEFVAAGGLVQHSSEHTDASVAKGRDVVIIGYSKSATDIAMHALAEGAKSVSMVYREPLWKIPYFFGGLVNFKNILYCRASEAMFMPWKPSSAGRIGRKLAAPAIWANWRVLESLLNLQFGLKKLKLKPKTRIEDSIHCATSIETPGFYKAVADGSIRMVLGNALAYGAGALMVDGQGSVPADIVIHATGWKQELPFLDAAIRDKLVGADGQYRLYRLIVNPDLPGLGFVGFNSSFITTLSAEVGAHWLARYIRGALETMPSEATMRKALDDVALWKTERPVAKTFGGLCVAPYHHFHFDQLMADIGARRKGRNPITANLAPISPRAYGALLATAPVLKKEPVG